MRLSDGELRVYRAAGHLTVPGVFPVAAMDAAIRDVERWGEDVLAGLPAADRAWYVEPGVTAREVLRKLDNPHFHRAAFRALARDPRLVALAESIIGPGVKVYFSQIFFKAPEGGGPKPAHQDNFYFGPDDPDGLVTAWIALDAATIENGCMQFAEGSNRGPVYPHVAPPGEPFNLQLTADEEARHPFAAAPVPRGGVSLHHGNTIHRSGANHSPRWRRACALHYVRNATRFVTPALRYDESVVVPIT